MKNMNKSKYGYNYISPKDLNKKTNKSKTISESRKVNKIKREYEGFSMDMRRAFSSTVEIKKGTSIIFEHFEYFMDYSQYFIEKLIEFQKLNLNRGIEVTYYDFSHSLVILVKISIDKIETRYERIGCESILKEQEDFIQDLMNEVFETDEEFRDNFELMFAY